MDVSGAVGWEGLLVAMAGRLRRMRAVILAKGIVLGGRE